MLTKTVVGLMVGKTQLAVVFRTAEILVEVVVCSDDDSGEHRTGGNDYNGHEALIMLMKVEGSGNGDRITTDSRYGWKWWCW